VEGAAVTKRRALERLPRLTKEERRSVDVVTPEFLAECVNPAGVFGEVDPFELARKLEPPELERLVTERALAKGLTKFEARLFAKMALIQLGHL
jgi:hypothetical protein